MLGAVVLLGAGCSSIGQRGTVTIQGRGVKELTQRGDQLMSTGKYAQKEVTPDYAAGYQKGIGDAGWREYWSLQDAQATPRQNGASVEGHTNFYPIEVPESIDAEGVKHAPRQVSVPVVEFVSPKGRL
jgi:hypothetical protein